VAGLALASATVACSASSARPPAELLQARAAYARASRGDARAYALADLAAAKATLDRAEALARSEPDSPEARTEAYVALRRAEKAEANADIRVSTITREGAEQAALSQIAAMRSQLQQSHVQLGTAQAQLATAGQSRQAAEQRASQALSALEQKGRARSEVHTKVIPNKVLFVKNTVVLLPAAKKELDQLAATLAQLQDRQIWIEGYTDTTGGDAVNGPLSQTRAQVVCDYLASHGIDRSRLAAHGRGSTNPIADNSTEAGRAMNRRVELLVWPVAGVTEPMPADRAPGPQGPNQQQQPKRPGRNGTP
jgi:outer membrane protein OmpA-like peptidoglycan-associated protein